MILDHKHSLYQTDAADQDSHAGTARRGEKAASGAHERRRARRRHRAGA
jgi:hypothetical protein